ncbi:hypothetical protein C8Q77DRAFT_1207809 [Trametes polyzona]|nr:hypothetical protein C8Q77DRAFT_1207809 [Trametes polyzona]
MAGLPSHLLGLRVLVQNWRGDEIPIVVFASRAQVVSQASLTAAVQWFAQARDTFVTFTEDRINRVAVCVANALDHKRQHRRGEIPDHIAHTSIPSVSDSEVESGAPLPQNIDDAKQVLVQVNTDEYFIVRLQSHVGNGDTISKDCTLLASLPTAQSLPSLPNFAATGVNRLLRPPFDQRAATADFANYIEHHKSISGTRART